MLDIYTSWSEGIHDGAPRKSFGCTSQVANLEKITLLEDGGLQSLWIPPFMHSPQSVTMRTWSFQDIMAQLPKSDKNMSDGIRTETVPTGSRFIEAQICGACERLLSSVRLAEACSKALVKLLYGCSSTVGPTILLVRTRNIDMDVFSRRRWP